MFSRAPIARRLAVATAVAISALAAPAPSAADTGVRSRFDLESVQGLLAVQRLDGWLLFDFQNQNPVARELVNPAGEPARRWFYLIPAQGQPTVLVHQSEVGLFSLVPGRKVEYAGWRDLNRALGELLSGARRVAIEYSEKGSLPTLSRVDAGTFELIKSKGVRISSSAELVQYTRSVWGPKGRAAHYVAAHHLNAIRADALDFIRAALAANRSITELQVQQRIEASFEMRGLTGAAPIVAVNSNAADPQYLPTARRASTIGRSDLIVLRLRAKVADDPDAVYAGVTWVAYAGKDVPSRYARAFEAVAQARDTALELIEARVKRSRPVRGYEVDQAARAIVGKAGLAERFLHRTGQSLDTTLHGAGAMLDDYETHDTRSLVLGTGYAIEPGVYIPGDFGVRTEVDVYIGLRKVETTAAPQAAIETLL